MAPKAKKATEAVEKVETDEIYNALMFLANEFEEDNAPLQAVRCYEALCLKEVTLLPVPEARARVRLRVAQNLKLRHAVRSPATPC